SVVHGWRLIARRDVPEDAEAFAVASREEERRQRRQTDRPHVSKRLHRNLPRRGRIRIAIARVSLIITHGTLPVTDGAAGRDDGTAFCMDIVGIACVECGPAVKWRASLYLAKNRGARRNMCGIVGYIGEKRATDVILSGLHRLEYRGYDSAGVAVLQNGSLDCIKSL